MKKSGIKGSACDKTLSTKYQKYFSKACIKYVIKSNQEYLGYKFYHIHNN